MRSPFERLWKDKMDIQRSVTTTVNSVTKTSDQIIATGIKCHYSGGSLTDIGANGIPELINSHMLFCSADSCLVEGDRVTITQRNGNQLNLTVGEGFPYKDGLQFRVKRDDTV